MKVLPSHIRSAARSGTFLYAIVEDIKLGLSTIRLGANGKGTRLTNLFTIGNPGIGDQVIVDFSTNKPYVRTIELEEEEEEEELPLVPPQVYTGGRWEKVSQQQASFYHQMGYRIDCNENTGHIGFVSIWFDADMEAAFVISKDNGETWEALYMDWEIEETYGWQWLNNNVIVMHDPFSSGNTTHYSIDEGLTWTSQVASNKAYKYYAFAKNTGTLFYYTAANVLVKSYNYGATYQTLTTIPYSYTAEEIAVSYNGKTIIVSKSDNYNVLTSFDGGNSWVISNPPGWLTYAHEIFASPDGSFVGAYCDDADPGGFYVSHNGIDWSYGADIGILDIAYDASTNTTFVAGDVYYEYDNYYGGYGFKMYKSIDGYNWTEVTSPSPATLTNYSVCYDNNTGTLYAFDGYLDGIHKSANYGNSWSIINPGIPESTNYLIPYCISGDGNFILSLGVGLYTISRNGGNTWEDIFHVDMDNCCMGDYMGQIFRAASDYTGTHIVFMDYVGCVWVSHDGMRTWSLKEDFPLYFGSSQGNKGSMSVSDNGRVMAVAGDNSGYGPWHSWMSFDYGETWQTYTPAIDSQLYYASVSNDGSTIIFSGYKSIYKITNDGATVESIPLPNDCTNYLYHTHTNSDGSVIVLNDHNEGLYRYEDSSWTLILEPDNYFPASSGFSGFALDASGKQIAIGIYDEAEELSKIAISFDGGQHWHTEIMGDGNDYEWTRCVVCGNDFSTLYAFPDWGWVWRRIPQLQNS